MILIKDKNNNTYVFCNVEFVLNENEKGKWMFNSKKTGKSCVAISMSYR